MTTARDSKNRKEDVIYAAFAESYFENAFFGMIKNVDNSLMQLLGFCLAFITAEAVITAFVNIAGQLTSLSIFFVLISYIAFLASAIIVILAISERAALSVEWSLDIKTMIDNCKTDLERLYSSKHRKQSISTVILFIGVTFLLASIIYAFTIVNF